MNASENQIVVYQPNETVRLDVRFENRTVWLSQKQMAELFGCSSENIIVHLKKIYREEELSEAATAKENLEVQAEGNRTVSRKIRRIKKSAFAMGRQPRSCSAKKCGAAEIVSYVPQMHRKG